MRLWRQGPGPRLLDLAVLIATTTTDLELGEHVLDDGLDVGTVGARGWRVSSYLCCAVRPIWDPNIPANGFFFSILCSTGVSPREHGNIRVPNSA